MLNFLSKVRIFESEDVETVGDDERRPKLKQGKVTRAICYNVKLFEKIIILKALFDINMSQGGAIFPVAELFDETFSRLSKSQEAAIRFGRDARHALWWIYSTSSLRYAIKFRKSSFSCSQ